MRCPALALALVLLLPLPASAMTMGECGQKYQDAQKAGTLAGRGWNDFRRQVCVGDAAVKTTEAASAASATAKTVATTPSEPAATPPAQTAAAGKPAVFPAAIDPKYASEPARTARLHSCLDQYRANKAKGDNGGLRWIEKGGGYYSQCSKRLKKA